MEDWEISLGDSWGDASADTLDPNVASSTGDVVTADPGGGGWSFPSSVSQGVGVVSNIANTLLGAYKAVSDVDLRAGQLELQRSTQASNVQLAKEKLAADTKTSSATLQNQGTLAALKANSEVALARAKAALPQALATIANPTTILVVAAAAAAFFFLRRRRA